MALTDVLSIAGSALSAESVRLNTTSSNLANAETEASSPEAAYRSRHPYFSTVLREVNGQDDQSVGVAVQGIMESRAPIPKRYEPDNPLADENGYVYGSNVNSVEEMVNMISASRSYQNNVEVFNTSKELLLRTLSLGQ